MPVNKKQKLNDPKTTVHTPITKQSIKSPNKKQHTTGPPYDINQHNLQCLLPNTDIQCDIEILDRRYNETEEQYYYYIHYSDIDRRLDCWVNESQIQQKSKYTHSKLSPAHSRIGQRTSQLSSASSDAVIDATERLLELEHEKKTRIKNIESIILNGYQIECWYYSPYHIDTTDIRVQLYICSYCLKYVDDCTSYVHHQQQCKARHPPGTEIYRDTDNNISVFEVSAAQQKLYCQNLCLLSKLFIDHKTLYYDVNNFMFYIMTEYIPNKGHNIVAYFSKEKHSTDMNNLACILTFPPYQRKGYGKFLIELSYALTRIEKTVGSPEKPLSDLGRVAYKAYWITQIIEYLYHNAHRLNNVKINEISEQTGIKIDDTVSALQAVSLIKYVKGEHVLAANTKSVQQHYKQQELLKQQAIDKGHVMFEMSKLAYSPAPAEEEETSTKRSTRGGAMSLKRRPG